MPEMKIRLTPEAVKAIEEIANRRNQALTKVEQGKIVVVEIRRKKII